MDRRSWLWRRKSSEKSSEKSPESSGSASPHSERFSGDQNIQSPEVTSTGVHEQCDEELSDDSVKSLSQKLSEALNEIRVKEDLVKQHSKVAEEAVSGWEIAENEVLSLKKQVDVLTHKNLNLEERVGHLDGALKECLRQLRQAREEQEENIHNAVIKKSSEWELTKSELENRILDLNSQLQNAKTNSVDTMLVDAEKENSVLKLKLQSIAKDLELSTLATETASKQHLDSIKKIAKLESECMRLKAAARKVAFVSENESLGDSEIVMKANNERNLGRSLIFPLVEIDLMDDFLEMEKLAAIPEPQTDKPSKEHEAMISRTGKLEKKLKKTEAEKVKLENALSECQIQLKEKEVKILDLSTQVSFASEAKMAVEKELESTKVKLKNTTKLLYEAEAKLGEIQNQLMKSNEAMNIASMELKEIKTKKTEVESKLKSKENELETLHSSIGALEKKLEEERKVSYEALTKCDVLGTELSNLKLDSRLNKSTIVEEFKINQEKELGIAASKFAECQKTIASLDRQLKSLATLDDFLIVSELQA